LAAELYAPVRDLLAGRDVRERGIYDPQAILRDLEAHRRGEKDVSERVFRIVQFELWVRMLNEHGPGNDTAPAPFRPVRASSPTTWLVQGERVQAWAREARVACRYRERAPQHPRRLGSFVRARGCGRVCKVDALRATLSGNMGSRRPAHICPRRVCRSRARPASGRQP
jgi:hypothetical protein